MYYDTKSSEQKNNYKNMLKVVGMLSKLFSEAKEPYLYYRSHENIFAKYFNAINNARSDNSADAIDNRVGIGLKTWIGGDLQKVAEFGRLRPQYKDLKGIELVQTIAEYRNKRIQKTKGLYDLDCLIYHIVKRFPSEMRIFESAFDEIDTENIKLEQIRDNSVSFTDGKHKYVFSLSKNTLFMDFAGMEEVDKFHVDIKEDPFTILARLLPSAGEVLPTERKVAEQGKNQLCLRLYTQSKRGKTVQLHSGLNQWNGGRTKYNKNHDLIGITKRHPDELYIPYPAEDRKRGDFFPPRDEKFQLHLPNNKVISAKVCQDDSKAIMSDPNKDLGHWLLRDVLKLPEGTLITYELLKEFNMDSVIFTKLGNKNYKIDFCPLGTYERFYGLPDEDAKLDPQS